MRNSIHFLPERKQIEINTILEVIKSVANPEMIILFGSYAKGKYVEDKYIDKAGTRYEYISDYDFLVITNENSSKASGFESQILEQADLFDPPLNLEIHSPEYVNTGLESGQYFFADIIKEGILLYSKGVTLLKQPRELTSEEQKIRAQEDFNRFFPKTPILLRQAQQNLSSYRVTELNDELDLGIFNLHQATEYLYSTVLLVFTHYKPKIHNLKRLRKKTKTISQQLFQLFRVETEPEDKRLFELLKQGYNEARYSTNFITNANDLQTLIEKVTLMHDMVKNICEERIASL